MKILVNSRWIDDSDDLIYEFETEEVNYIYKKCSFRIKDKSLKRIKGSPEHVIDQLYKKARNTQKYLFTLLNYEFGEYLNGIDSENSILGILIIGKYYGIYRGASDNINDRCSDRIIHMPSKSEYVESFKKVHEKIRLGHTYQINLTRRIFVNSELRPVEVFDRIDKEKYSALFPVSSKRVLISDSPELLFKIKDEVISVKPIKGTVNKERQDFKTRLINSEKDKRELMMITDLLRNDISSLILSHSLKVRFPEYMELKDVAHLFSIVSGRLKKDLSLSQILGKLFPGGSITGVPKKRTMEIIKENEADKRGFYTGSLGMISPDGDMTFNILIRSLYYDGVRYIYGSGGGITWWSDPELEFNELVDKSKKLKRIF